MEVSYSKGVAIYADPESCVWIRKGAREALTGARMGQVLSRESKIHFGGPTVSYVSEGNMGSFVIARTSPPPRGRRPCARTEVAYTGAGRSRFWPREMAPRSAL